MAEKEKVVSILKRLLPKLKMKVKNNSHLHPPLHSLDLSLMLLRRIWSNFIWVLFIIDYWVFRKDWVYNIFEMIKLYFFFFTTRALPSISGGGSRFKSSSKTRETEYQWESCFHDPAKRVEDTGLLLALGHRTRQDPSQEALALSKEAELGKKKVVFPNKKGNFQHFKDALEREYDKLKSRDGAFELMRAVSSGTSRPLKLISSQVMGTPFPMLKMLQETIPKYTYLPWKVAWVWTNHHSLLLSNHC